MAAAARDHAHQRAYISTFPRRNTKGREKRCGKRKVHEEEGEEGEKDDEEEKEEREEEGEEEEEEEKEEEEDE